MSYTAPQYVDTKEQAVLALASVIADEDKGALGDGSVNRALDVLADVLAQQDVQVPQTNAGAILALAQYVTGGGGGSSDFTTAHVTVTSNVSISGKIFHVCTLVGLDEMSLSAPSPTGSGTTLEFDAILYKGNAVIMADAPVATTSGAIQQMSAASYLITGDCTITIA